MNKLELYELLHFVNIMYVRIDVTMALSKPSSVFLAPLEELCKLGQHNACRFRIPRISY